MSEDYTKEDFRQDMLADAHEERMNVAEEIALRNDYDKFRDNFSDVFIDAIDAIKELKRLHKMFDYDFDIKELEDEL